MTYSSRKRKHAMEGLPEEHEAAAGTHPLPHQTTWAQFRHLLPPASRRGQAAAAPSRVLPGRPEPPTGCVSLHACLHRSSQDPLPCPRSSRASGTRSGGSTWLTEKRAGQGTAPADKDQARVGLIWHRAVPPQAAGWDPRRGSQSGGRRGLCWGEARRGPHRSRLGDWKALCGQGWSLRACAPWPQHMGHRRWPSGAPLLRVQAGPCLGTSPGSSTFHPRPGPCQRPRRHLSGGGHAGCRGPGETTAGSIPTGSH